jgi:hypothetical protein
MRPHLGPNPSTLEEAMKTHAIHLAEHPVDFLVGECGRLLNSSRARESGLQHL